MDESSMEWDKRESQVKETLMKERNLTVTRRSTRYKARNDQQGDNYKKKRSIVVLMGRGFDKRP